MAELLLLFFVGTLINWIALLLVIPIARKLADFSMPPWPETMWKLAVVSAAVNLVSVAVSPVHWLLAWVVAVIVYWTLIVKWFEVDLFGAVVIVLVSWVVNLVLTGALMGVLL